MNIEKLRVSGFEAAIRGMRNPYDSWEKSDSYFGLDSFEGIDDYWIPKMLDIYLNNKGAPGLTVGNCSTWLDHNGVIYEDGELCEFAFIGPNDMDLAQRLISGGSEHRKFLRQINVSFDLTLPFYIWKEFDTYKVGTTANSCSTMHTLKNNPITLDCFELDDFENIPFPKEYQRPDAKSNCDEDFIQMCLIPYLESLRLRYKETGDKKYWKELVRWLPEGWLQKRTITLNYEVIYNFCHQRKNHRLAEWHAIVNFIREHLPYANEFIFLDELKAEVEEVEEDSFLSELFVVLSKLGELKDGLYDYTHKGKKNKRK
jgi:hypothetical protein